MSNTETQNDHDWPARQTGQLGFEVSAKLLTWEQDKFGQWTDNDHGFSISEENGEYTAAWGEGDCEEFTSIEDAKEWCQSEIDLWIRSYCLLTPCV